MTKVRVVSSSDALQFQNSVNTFIQDKKVIDIKYQPILLAKEYTSGVPTRTVMIDRALIIYEEETNNAET